MSTKTIEDHFSLLADIGEISSLLLESPDLQGFLDRSVVMVAKHLHAEVCSIYLYDEDTRQLTLQSTFGLSQESVGRIHLEIGEGLVGKALKELRPICVAHASQHPDFKYFPELGEEPFDAFLGVPILRGVDKIGILVVQRHDHDCFSNTEVIAMRALTAQLATTIETARTLMQVAAYGAVAKSKVPLSRSFFINGTSASPGYALGKSVQFRLHPVERILNRSRKRGSGTGGRAELETAIASTLEQLKALQGALDRKLPEVASLIFEAHMMMLKDKSFVGTMFEHMDNGDPATRAVAEVAAKYIRFFEGSKHDYIREKARDVEDLTLRLLANLDGVDDHHEVDWRGRIVIARQLLPSDVLRIMLADVAGLVLVSGGLTSHVSILVRSLAIPMIIAENDRLTSVVDGDSVLLDADAGNVFVNPGTDILERYAERERLREKAILHKQNMHDETRMRDGTRVTLLANINLLTELDVALDLKAEGIGLYRTEFPFLVRQALPSEEEQYLVYSKLLLRMGDRDVTMRTLDAGGDKMIAYFSDGTDPNPALGLRSTRLTLKYKEIFDQQLRAILRAGAGMKRLRVMFPMISSLDEFEQARRRLLECAEAIEAESGETINRPQIGMMVELPCVIDLADEFAREADFFSIGTNDFIQYMLAVDRSNASVSAYYCPHHPSVLRGLKRVADAALRRKIDCVVCGEMAHDARYVPFFLGIGVRRLSIDPHFLPEIQQSVMRWSAEDSAAYAASLLKQSTIKAVESLLREDAPV